jgi:hypothetical protein
MRDRTFIAAVALIGALALLILVGNIRDAGAPLYGPPNVDKKEVMSQVESGRLSFDEARFYSPERDRPAESEAQGEAESETAPSPPHEAGSKPRGGPEEAAGAGGDE